MIRPSAASVNPSLMVASADDQPGTEHGVGQARPQHQLFGTMHGGLPPVAVARLLGPPFGVDPATASTENEETTQVDDARGYAALSNAAVGSKAKNVLGALHIDLKTDLSPASGMMDLRKMDDSFH
jgi:hypothetical protein